MTIKIVQGSPKKLFDDVSGLVDRCFEGIWSAEDLRRSLEIPHDSEVLLVAYDEEKAIGYAFVVTDYIEDIDTTIASIQEICLLSDYRESDIAEQFIEKAITFSRANNAGSLEQIVSTIDSWIIPTLIKKKLTPSEIKADREISSFNEAKLILNNLKKNPKLNILMNQLFFEKNNELSAFIVESESDFDSLTHNDLIAFGSIIHIDKTEDLENTLDELYNNDLEWDEIGITFDYKL
jgi:hypothetical protein